MKNLLNILFFVLGFINTSAQSNELKDIFTKKTDSISFKSSGFNSSRQLILLNNNEFIRIEIYVSDYGGESTFNKYYGKYKLTDSILILKPKKIELKTYSGNPERKTTEEKIDYKSDSELKITTVFVIKQHSDQQYLIPEEYGIITDLQFEKILKKLRRRLLKRTLVK